MGLRDFAQSTAWSCRTGKRALEIATTIALDPEMMLLDEPTAGMGHEDIDRIVALIKSVSADRTISWCEHNLSVGGDALRPHHRAHSRPCADPRAITRPSLNNPEVPKRYEGYRP